MRTTLYLDEGIVDKMEELAEEYKKTDSEIARALIKAGSRVAKKGGISTEGTLLKLNRPFVETRYRDRKNEKKRFGIRLKDLEDEINEKLKPESISGYVTSLLKLGLIAHDPSSFELTGLLGGPRPFTELNVPEIDTERLLRKE